MPTKPKLSFPLKVGSLYQHPQYGVIYITGGYYTDPIYGRLSNHWTARRVRKDGRLGQEVSFYGERLVCLDEQYEKRFLRKKPAKK